MIDSFLAPRGNFLPGEPLDQLEISALTECELKRLSGAFRAGAPSPLACLPLVRPLSLSPTTSKRLLRSLIMYKRDQIKMRDYIGRRVYPTQGGYLTWLLHLIGVLPPIRNSCASDCRTIENTQELGLAGFQFDLLPIFTRQ